MTAAASKRAEIPGQPCALIQPTAARRIRSVLASSIVSSGEKPPLRARARTSQKIASRPRRATIELDDLAPQGHAHDPRAAQRCAGEGHADGAAEKAAQAVGEARSTVRLVHDER